MFPFSPLTSMFMNECNPSGKEVLPRGIRGITCLFTFDMAERADQLWHVSLKRLWVGQRKDVTLGMLYYSCDSPCACLNTARKVAICIFCYLAQYNKLTFVIPRFSSDREKKHFLYILCKQLAVCLTRVHGNIYFLPVWVKLYSYALLIRSQSL